MCNINTFFFFLLLLSVKIQTKTCARCCTGTKLKLELWKETKTVLFSHYSKHKETDVKNKYRIYDMSLRWAAAALLILIACLTVREFWKQTVIDSQFA